MSDAAPPHADALSFYRRFARRNALVFDIGANHGNRTELFLDLGLRVVAVEPQPDCVEILRGRFGTSIELISAAVGAKPGRAELRVATYHTLASLSDEWIDEVRRSGRFSEFEWPEVMEVDVLTLDSLVERYGVPDFCKIDVEG